MKTSDAGIALITRLEGSRSKVYKDVAGLPTIGVGHLLTKSELTSGKIVIGGLPVRYAEGLADSQIRDLLRQDLAASEKAVHEGILSACLQQHQFDALVSFVFNVGRGAFLSSTLLRRIKEGRMGDVPDQFRRWVFAGGRRVKGLERRREEEIKMWEGRL